MTHRLLFLVAVGLLASLAACGDGETNVAPTTPVAPTMTEEQPSSDVEPFPTGEPVDLVYISDSGGAGVVERYAELAAEANGAVFVSFFDVFNGPEHDEDPREKGWIQDDGMHANDKGGPSRPKH
ncbi:MAG: SGNH/GDSL hydrolase family protein [Acidimicrobiia bacterium]|nr:SGNH/GDSL hydrolase family protein [Acidimicrobiia bacterium]